MILRSDLQGTGVNRPSLRRSLHATRHRSGSQQNSLDALKSNQDGTGNWLIGQFDPVGGQDTPGASNVNPVPEPTSLALVSLGLAVGLIGRARARRNRAS